MISEKNSLVIVYRAIIVALAFIFFFLPFLEGDPADFIHRKRFLTNWGFYFSFATAILMLLRSLGKIEKRYDGLVSATIILNMLVVFLYWKLYFEDPALVNGNGGLPWWKEYYLHLFRANFYVVGCVFDLWCFSKDQTYSVMACWNCDKLPSYD